MLGLVCHAHVGVFMEEDLGRIALSCHVALDILCDKDEFFFVLNSIPIGTTAIKESLRWPEPRCSNPLV